MAEGYRQEQLEAVVGVEEAMMWTAERAYPPMADATFEVNRPGRCGLSSAFASVEPSSRARQSRSEAKDRVAESAVDEVVDKFQGCLQCFSG